MAAIWNATIDVVAAGRVLVKATCTVGTLAQPVAPHTSTAISQAAGCGRKVITTNDASSAAARMGRSLFVPKASMGRPMNIEPATPPMPHTQMRAKPQAPSPRSSAIGSM